MTPVVIALLSLIVFGLPITLAIDRRARGGLLLGTAFLYGSAFIFFVLLALSLLNVRWSVVSVAGTTLPIWLLLWFFKRPATAERRPVTFHWLDVFTAFTLFAYAVYATVAPVWEWDFWALWGLKARVFFEYRGIDWRFLESPWNEFAHTDYPVLLPTNYAFIGLLNGGWSDRWLGLLTVGYVVAVVLIVRDLAAQETSPFIAALITAIATGIAASRFIGIAEAPMIAYGAAAVLFVRRSLLFDDGAAWRHGVVLLGCGANVKNEGLALGVAVVIALLIVKAKKPWRLWPSLAIAAPWLLLRAFHVLPTDLLGGSMMERLWTRLHYPASILLFLAETLSRPLLWEALLVGLALAPAANRRRERFVLIVTCCQLVFFVSSYFVTALSPLWHIASSWLRLTWQAALPITYVVVLMLAGLFPRGRQSSADGRA